MNERIHAQTRPPHTDTAYQRSSSKPRLLSPRGLRPDWLGESGVGVTAMKPAAADIKTRVWSMEHEAGRLRIIESDLTCLDKNRWGLIYLTVVREAADDMGTLLVFAVLQAVTVGLVSVFMLCWE